MSIAAAAAVQSGTARVSRTIAPAILALGALGLALRLWAARGDLWLDEIWSFLLVGKVHSYADIVLALPYDNNHVLNSLWLRLVGDQASSLVVRLPAILFGMLSISVAARIGFRVSPLASLAAATLIATDITFVQFGSEARGYSGLILAILLAVDALEARLEDTADRQSLIVLACAIAFGTFSHLIMVEATCLICATATIRLILAEGATVAGLRRLAPILAAATAGTLPAAVCFGLSLTSGPLHVGIETPFSVAGFAEGLGGMVRVTLGLWASPLSRSTSEAFLLIAMPCVAAAIFLLPLQRRVLPAIALIGLPLAHWALHLPNQFYARFHLVTGVCLVLFSAEVWARAWKRGGIVRALALLAAIGFLAGQYLQLAQFFAKGRGQFAAATALMSKQGPTRLAVLPAIGGSETAAVMRWYAKRMGQASDIVLVPNQTICTTPPNWVLILHRPDDAMDVDDATRLATIPCATHFAVEQRYPAFGFSGFAWTILRDRTVP